jgi:hypothetical protein
MPKNKLPDKDFEGTSKLAYAIGLLTTDGNLSKDGIHLEFTSKDRELVEIFRKCLGLKSKIGLKSSGRYREKKYFRVQFGNVVFYRWLQRIGLCPNKTRKLGELKIPDKYFRDFLRRHLDGDGDIDVYKDYYNTFKNPKYIYDRIFVRFRSASRRHMEWLRSKIFNILSIKGHLNGEGRNSSKTTMWILKFGKKDSLKLLSWLYYSPNVPCLKRKRKIAERFIRMMK